MVIDYYYYFIEKLTKTKQKTIRYPRTEESAMLVTTRMTQTEYRADCDFTTPDCSFENITEPLDVFVADIDRYTVS